MSARRNLLWPRSINSRLLRHLLLLFRLCLTHSIITPSRPEHRWLYPIDQPELLNVIRFRRTRGRLRALSPAARSQRHPLRRREVVGRRRCYLARRSGEELRCLRTPAKLPIEQLGFSGIDAPATLRVTRVVLASAHLNHDPCDNRGRNLAALCQRCHVLHDAPEHRRCRWYNAFRLRAIGDLFG